MASKSAAMLSLRSSSLSLLSSKKDLSGLGDDHFRWQSIQKYLYFASTYAASIFNFDIFTGVKITDFLLLESTIGIGYMCMDSFIKQYTKRFDCNKFMNPLLRGISYGRFMQTALFLLVNYLNPLDFYAIAMASHSLGSPRCSMLLGIYCIDECIAKSILKKKLEILKKPKGILQAIARAQHASYLADSIRFLIASFHVTAPWALCPDGNNTCVSAKDIILLCSPNMTIDFTTTSSHYNYKENFGAQDRNTLTTRYFILGIVWMLVFFISSVTEDTIVKIFRLTFMFVNISTVVTLLFLLVSTKDNVGLQAFSQIVDISAPGDIEIALRNINYVFGIGYLGLYDFGTMSSHTMIDTAVVIFVTSFTLFALLRSLLVRMLTLILHNCVKLPKEFGVHFLFFSILPLSTEFLNAHKLYVFYIYGTVLIGTLVYMTYLILILSKFLSYEFHSVKMIYIIGILCFVGLSLSIPYLGVLIQLKPGNTRFILHGLDTISIYLGGYYVAVVMWLYGLEKFCTDIQFWLGFRPTRFWTIIWSLLPVVLFGFTVQRVYGLIIMRSNEEKWVSIAWVIATFLVVAIWQIKSAAGFVMKNNLAGLFKSNKNYGPPELEDRKRRLYYSEYTRRRTCKHNCLVIDEWVDCNHQLITMSVSKTTLSDDGSDTSLMNIYDAKSRLKSIGALSARASTTRGVSIS